MSGARLQHEIQLLLASIASLEKRARGSEADPAASLDESIEELRTTVEELRVADDELRAESAVRRSLQAALDAEGRRYRDLFELAPDCQLVTNRGATIQLANVAAGHLFKVAAVFLVGKPLAIFVPLDERRHFRTELGRVAALGLAANWEGRVRPRDGNPIEVAFTAAPVHDPRGQLEGFQWLIRDISARKRAEAAVLSLQEDLERRVAERTAALESANRQASEAIRARDSLMSIISHDLKHPLSVIKGYTQLLGLAARRGRALSPHRLTDTVDKIEAAIDRLTAQIDEILDLSRAQLGRALEVQWQPVDLVALARRAVTDCSQSSSGHHIVLACEETRVICPGDPSRLRRVLDNLLSNAVKFSPAGGDVVVRVGWERGERDNQVFVAVVDHGVGIPPAEIPRVFDLFHRAPNVEEDAASAGIGLASARQIVELHGGTIDVTSQVGLGATFVVRLPVAV